MFLRQTPGPIPEKEHTLWFNDAALYMYLLGLVLNIRAPERDKDTARETIKRGTRYSDGKNVLVRDAAMIRGSASERSRTGKATGLDIDTGARVYGSTGK